MAELLVALTPRLQGQVDSLLQIQQQQQRWHGALPVLLLDRCWLQLQRVGVEELARALPPDSTGDAPELVMFRAWRQQGLDPLQAQERIWQEFGRESCSLALRRFWQAQERGHHGWTLSAYLQLLERYRQLLEADGPTPIPLLVLAREGNAEHHRLHWCWP
ncbi:MAG: hypothetical protein FJ049_04820 [Cyanobacteria bacterium M_surface_7_m2_037]|nr:hypothetical protein [Cyanobacteria bacterium K_DeepCast_0m_m1_088]MBM5795432.1 hypothetical protein [Cyanobacteria bacterium M_surface_7_m2_037]MBM5820168.1 hypothetical protein [Cyanobacteria bacterium K_DeepCast_150m_m2_101]